MSKPRNLDNCGTDEDRLTPDAPMVHTKRVLTARKSLIQRDQRVYATCKQKPKLGFKPLMVRRLR